MINNQNLIILCFTPGKIDFRPCVAEIDSTILAELSARKFTQALKR